MSHIATCNKCKTIVIAGFSQAKTEEIASRNRVCAICNNRELMKVTIEEIKDELPID
jgi:DNA-directed RNA polymerase subunit RPC12/RpoP